MTLHPLPVWVGGVLRWSTLVDMCRYIRHPVKNHGVCLDCRRSCKGATVCPECAQPMIDAGQDFKPPKRRNRNQWRKVALLLGNGVTFHTCGCRGPGDMPRTLADAKQAGYTLDLPLI